MIAYRYTNVFESMGPLENVVLATATRLMTSFQRIVDFFCANRSDPVPEDLIMNFNALLVDYIESFTAWKIPDEAKLIERIKIALTALHEAGASLGPDEPENSTLRTELRTQTARLRARFLKMAGVDKVAEFDINLNSSATSNAN